MEPKPEPRVRNNQRNDQRNDWADFIDMLTLHPEERRKVVRLLGEIEAIERR